MLYIAIGDNLQLSGVVTDEPSAWATYSLDDVQEEGGLSDSEALFILPADEAIAFAAELARVAKEKLIHKHYHIIADCYNTVTKRACRFVWSGCEWIENGRGDSRVYDSKWYAMSDFNNLPYFRKGAARDFSLYNSVGFCVEEMTVDIDGEISIKKIISRSYKV